MVEDFLKIQPLKEILELQDCKKGYETYTIKKFSNEKLNQVLKIYKMNFINQKSNKKKVLNFVLRSNGSLRVKNALKLFSKYLKEGICKIKQYLKHMLMIINQNILATLLTFSNMQKNFYEKLYTKETTSKTATTEFISKIPNRKEISNEQFHLCEAKIL